MSLKALSTELDTNILEYLCNDRPSLSAMSMVSKYYRRIAEPILYRDLEFRLVTTSQIKNLLLTTVYRKEVAKHVRSLTIPSPRRPFIPHARGTLEGDQKHKEKRLRSDELKIRELLRKARTFFPNPRLVDRWSENVVLGCDDSSNISFDGHLALFLIQATNIEQIHLTSTMSDKLGYSGTVLGLNWQFYDPDPAFCPFNKLKDVCINFDKANFNTEFGIVITVPRFVKRFRLPNCHVYKLKALSSFAAALEELDLQNVALNPLMLVRSLQSEQFGNLRRLNLDGVRDSILASGEPTWFGELFDYRVLSNALVKYTPLLEVLDMRTDRFSDTAWPFDLDSLEGLARLHTLRVDVDRLVFADGLGNTEPFDPHHILPPSLQNLELTQLPVKRVNRYCEEPDDVEKRPSSVQFIVDTIRTFPPLKSLDLGICMLGHNAHHGSEDRIPTDTAVNLLRKLVQEAMDRNIMFQVYSGDWRTQPRFYAISPDRE